MVFSGVHVGKLESPYVVWNVTWLLKNAGTADSRLECKPNSVILRAFVRACSKTALPAKPVIDHEACWQITPDSCTYLQFRSSVFLGLKAAAVTPLTPTDNLLIHS